ncbi:MAG: DNA-directed RNA polymerase subunit omega [Candidatus Omnitrophica bacterium]|nr:DNA-directed RNA polymerase subunit omega [Candidatus Omnitrophota bacterium]
MIDVSLEELLKKTGSLYKLVNLASKRALQLNEGAPPLIKSDEKMKYPAIALKEILEGKIDYKVKSGK